MPALASVRHTIEISLSLIQPKAPDPLPSCRRLQYVQSSGQCQVALASTAESQLYRRERRDDGDATALLNTPHQRSPVKDTANTQCNSFLGNTLQPPSPPSPTLSLSIDHAKTTGQTQSRSPRTLPPHHGRQAHGLPRWQGTGRR